MSVSPILTYYNIGDGITAFSTTRHGGHSHGDYAELNINSYCGDNASDVAANKLLLAKKIDVNADKIVMPHQTHGTEVRQIGQEFFALPANVRTMVLEGVDALMTDLEGVCVGVSTADCIPILLYDKEHHAVGAVHAGWRGTVAKIAQRAVAAMNISYHTSPSALCAVIGPGISLAAFEVGDEVYEQFAAAGFDMGRISRREQKWHIDLWECNRLQLVETGIAADNISVSGICTYSNYNDYFSARRLGTASGRIFTGILLNKTNNQ